MSQGRQLPAGERSPLVPTMSEKREPYLGQLLVLHRAREAYHWLANS